MLTLFVCGVYGLPLAVLLGCRWAQRRAETERLLAVWTGRR